LGGGVVRVQGVVLVGGGGGGGGGGIPTG